MRLYMKQKVFSWKDRFYIKDEYGRDCYYVEGELFSVGKKFHIYNMRGEEMAYVQQKVISFLPRFYVWVGGQQVAEIEREFTFFQAKYLVHGPEWVVNGHFWEHDYQVSHNGRIIADVHKAWASWGDSYEIDIDDDESETMALAVVLAIDAVMEAEASSNAST